MSAAEPGPRVPGAVGGTVAQALVWIEQALACAEAGDWTCVAELDARIQAEVQAMGEPAAEDDPEALAADLMRLRDSHRRLLQLAETQRARLVEARRESARGRDGARAYEENA